MSSALSSQRSWIARVAVLAMLASLMAFGAAPAGAAIATDNACPSSIPSFGFTDLGGVPAAAVDAIDCIADYGISTGTSATTFDPFSDVTRWQMALFLTRQAEIHGVTLPDGSDQGFTDLTGVPAAAVTAINQTAQLGISTGTSATTFDPNSAVERWQMALFITRLVDAAGVTLPDGSDQGFTDLTGVPDSAVTAINQVAQLEISEGTSATTFDPFSAVQRWAMALFLARTLEADGITPPISADFTFSPSGDTEVDSDTEQDFTISGLVPGDDYQVALIDSDEVDTSGSTVVFGDDEGASNEADGLGDDFTGSPAITKINGVSTGGVTEETVEADTDGEVEVSVESDTFETFYIIVFIDDDGDEDLDLNADNEPNEDFGLSGKVSILAPEAANGFSSRVEVLEVSDTFFVGDDGGDIWTFFYDAGDDHSYNDGFNISESEFMDWLTVGDDVDPDTYSRSAGSTFDLENDIPDAPTGVTAVDGDFDETSGDTDSNDVEVSWDEGTGGNIDDFEVWLYLEDDDEDTDCFDGVPVVGLFDSEDAAEGNSPGGREVVFPNQADDDYCAVVWAISETGDYGDPSEDDADAVVTVDTGETGAPEIDDLDLTDNVTVGLVDGGDVLVFTFNETMDSTLGDDDTTFFRVTDSDSVYQIACGGGLGVGDATCVQSTDTETDDVLTVTLDDAPLFISGTENGLDVLDVPEVSAVSAAWDDVAGNQLSLDNSTDVTVD